MVARDRTSRCVSNRGRMMTARRTLGKTQTATAPAQGY